MGQVTLGEFWDRSGDTEGVLGRVKDPRRGTGWVGGPSRRSVMGQETLTEVRDESETLQEVGTGWCTLSEVRDVCRDLRGCLRLVGRTSWRSGTGRGTFRKVQEGLGDARRGLGQVEGISGRSGTGQRTLVEVWDGSGDPWKVRDGSGDPPEGP